MWVAGFRNEVERMTHVRALFRYVLGNEEECRYAYSICWEAWVKESATCIAWLVTTA